MSQPSPLAYQHLADTFQSSHLIDESLHDDNRYYREQFLIVLNRIYLKDNEAFTEQVDIFFGVQQEVKATAAVILAKSSQEVVDVEVLFVYWDRTLCHFLTVIVAHKLVE